MHRRDFVGRALATGALGADAFATELRPSQQQYNLAGRPAARLDAARLDALIEFVRTSAEALGVPGVALGVAQGNETLFSGGFGVRQIGSSDPVDADTLFLIASNTKPLTSLMLAKLVEEGRIGWRSTVADLLPAFALADPAVTRQVEVRHLLCACTGLPYRNIDWEFANPGADASLALEVLPRMNLTSAFGETYSYTNPIASAGGLLGGHLAFPGIEPGIAYDNAMQTRVFDPLGMTRTTFNFDEARQGNFAHTYGLDPFGNLRAVDPQRESRMRLIRPAGGAWSNVTDLLAYVKMEMARGRLPDGSRYISEATLTERWKAQVATGPHSYYGMGLDTDQSRGVPVMYHGGRFYGFRGDTIWLPDQRVGVVILMNASTGTILTEALRDKLLELVLDAAPMADAKIARAVDTDRQRRASIGQDLSYPVPPNHAALVGTHYRHPYLGEVRIARDDGHLRFDYGGWTARVASREVDGGVSFTPMTASPPPPMTIQRQVGSGSLFLREGRNDYVFECVGQTA